MDTKKAADALRQLTTGTHKTLTKINPCGSLQARKDKTGGIIFFWRYSIGSFSERVEIGAYNPLIPPKTLAAKGGRYTLAAAIRHAEELAATHHASRDDGGYMEVRRQQEEQRAAKKAQRESEQRATLTALLSDYCERLQAQGKQSYKDVQSIFSLHLINAFPALAGKPAKAVTSEDIADAMRLLNEAGKQRTANKLRSYTSAAFQTAKNASSDASVPVKFKRYQITHNPATDTAPITGGNRADKNPLSLAELRIYWNCIKDVPDRKAALLRLHLLTGGQRIEQLLRLTHAGIAPDSVTLIDGKGASGVKRQHVVPLTKQAAAALQQAIQPAGEYAFSSDSGNTHIQGGTLNDWALELVGTQIEGFTLKRIRSGVETALAAARVSAEIRGRLQSHGISGVQSRHYDAHDYAPEKLEALQTIWHMLNDAGGKVLHLPPKTA